MRRRVSVMNSRLPYSSTGPGRLLALDTRSWPLRQQDGIEEKHEEDDGDAIGRSVDRGEGRPTASGEIYTIVDPPRCSLLEQ